MTWASRRPDMITTSTPARLHASSARACRIENSPSASRKSAPNFPSRVPSRSVYTQRRGMGRAQRYRPPMPQWRLRDRTLEFPPPLAAGIVNVTDDSFFEGARSATPEQAVADGLALVEAGFDMLDVGAVAARSGPAVEAEDEAARLVPAVRELAERAGVPVLADTFSAAVAEPVIDAGAAGINDISGGADPALLD